LGGVHGGCIRYLGQFDLNGPRPARWADPVQDKADGGHVAGQRGFNRLSGDSLSFAFQKGFDGKGSPVTGSGRLAAWISALAGLEVAGVGA
jgi:hypothetical protein